VSSYCDVLLVWKILSSIIWPHASFSNLRKRYSMAGNCSCGMCVLSSLPKEHITVDEDISIPDSLSANVCLPPASNLATFHWEWNGLFMFPTSFVC